MASIGITTATYLKHCQASDKTTIKLLSKDFKDRHRYDATANPVATTWLISLGHISRDDLLTAHYLRFMSFLAEKDVPASLPPPADELDTDGPVGTLKVYAFITRREQQDAFDMHRLVRLAMRNWLEKRGKKWRQVAKVIGRLAEEFSFPDHENKDVWVKYLPHAQAILEAVRPPSLPVRLLGIRP